MIGATFASVNQSQLENIIRKKKSYLCVGLDSRVDQLPESVGNRVQDLLEFNRQIIESTSDLAAAYKINTAFYEQYGTEGWEILQETLDIIPDDCFTIADAKRGDIGNTSSMYAKAFFENMSFDSITVSPYMGSDSIKPFLDYGKTVIVLALTSNAGSADFQHLEADGKPLYQHVLETTTTWADPDQLMFVVGATRADHLQKIRTIIPDHFLLVPGVGKQGGSLTEVSEYGMNERCGLLVNSSRGIIFASSGEDFATAARNEALKLQKEMSGHLI